MTTLGPVSNAASPIVDLVAYRIDADSSPGDIPAPDDTLGFDPDAPAHWPIRPAPLRRAWMDAFPDRWPYRCLPLNIANQSGWELLSPVSFTATWAGEIHPASLRVEFDERADLFANLIKSHFGAGILTFAPPLLFRTREPIGLFVRGPTNSWVDGAAALDGWTESWGLEANFTMNWKITRADTPVRFEIGQPFCLIQPFDVGMLERIRPMLRDLAADPALEASFDRWRRRRAEFASARRLDQSQHIYTQGRNEAGDPVPGHRTTLELHDFIHQGRRE